MTQLTLQEWSNQPAEPEQPACAKKAPARRMTIQERCDVFCAANPWFYRMFRSIAAQRLREGFEHYSADRILHLIRERLRFAELRKRGRFCVNNDYAAPLSRRLMREDERFKDFFEVRRSGCDK